MEMIKKLREKKGGFTLVELIVVLVILALLAAILVPTLLGYITKANEEKDYSAAQTVRVAAQSEIDEALGKKVTVGTTFASDTTGDLATYAAQVDGLAGVDTSTTFSFTVSNNAITKGWVKIGTQYYKWDGAAWSGTGTSVPTFSS